MSNAPAFNYAKSAATADRLITKFGAPVSIKSLGSSTYDPNTGSATAVENSQPGTGVLLDYSPGEKNKDGNLIQTGDRKLLLSTKGLIFAPKVGDVITFNCTDYTVIALETLAPAGLPVLFKCQVRK